MKKEKWLKVNIKGMDYKISNYGNIVGKRGKIKPRLSKDGYLVVTLGNQYHKRVHFYVHRLVALYFVPNIFNKEEVNHKDFCRTNNYFENLEWVTHQENITYTIKNNYENFCKGKRGKNNGRAVYTEEEVLKMRELYKNGLTVMEIVSIFYPNLSYSGRKNKWSRIDDIVKRKTWTNI